MSFLWIEEVGDNVTVGDKNGTYYLDDSDIDRIVAIRDARRAKEREAQRQEYLRLKAIFEPEVVKPVVDPVMSVALPKP